MILEEIDINWSRIYVSQETGDFVDRLELLHAEVGSVNSVGSPGSLLQLQIQHVALEVTV